MEDSEEPDENEPPEKNISNHDKDENNSVDKDLNGSLDKDLNGSLDKDLNISLEKDVNISQKESSIPENALSGTEVLETGEQSIIPNIEEEDKIIKEEVAFIQPKIGYDAGGSGAPTFANFHCSTLLQKRNPFIHDPPQPEERRARVENPRTAREYIINLREDLADFQESHGLPRTRDYSFLSLGLALAQETARALCSLFFMFVELFPILAIVSLIFRFALDKLIEILETTEPAQKVRKAIIFSLQMLLILIPLWIFVGTIIIPLVALVFSIFKKLFYVRGSSKDCRKKENIKGKGSSAKKKPCPS